MILVWSLPGDRQTALVLDALARKDAAYFFFDQHEVLTAEIELHAGTRVSGFLKVGSQRLDLADVTAAYLRPYETSQIPSVARTGAQSTEHQRAVELEDALIGWSEITPALVVNRLSDMGPNGSKPYQAALIKACGFKTPDTLVTTDPEAVWAFWDQHPGIIYKSISGIRSIVSRLCIEDADRLAKIRWCPTQFQEYVPGDDYRVHVVGDRIFTTRIVSLADDYRYASRKGEKAYLEASEVPKEVAERCLKMAHKMRLWVSGIDLRLTPQGEWYCFEVNPSPGFTYFQDACDFAIDEAIAHLLIAGRLP